MHFSLNNPRKGNRLALQRARDARKAARDAAEVEAVLETFQNEFGDGDDDADGRANAVTFVRGGLRRPDARDGVDDARVGEAHALGARDEPAPAAKRKGAAAANDVEAGPSATRGKKKRKAIDAMLEEFAAKAPAAKEASARSEPASTSERVETTTANDASRSSNVRIANLPVDVSDADLARAFERYGPIASVKIWRPGKESRETANSGYVCFMSRTSAERAVEEMHDALLFGNTVNVDISMAMRIPQHAIWPTTLDANEAAELLTRAPAEALGDIPWSVAPTATSDASVGADVIVQIPDDEDLKRRIDITAAYVAEDGEIFERALKAREAANEEYQFLFDESSQAHAYYAWRVFAFAQSDGLETWRTEPFVMIRDGARWIPPPLDATKASRLENRVGRSSKRAAMKLSTTDRTSLIEILQHITVARDEIRDAMEFAVERAECAADVVDVIATSLCNLETPRQTMTARLYVVSDLLHNCAAPVKGVQAYRALFIRALPSVFERLELYLEAAPSSASRRAFKRDVLATLRAWSDWCAFTDDFIGRLRGSAFAVDD